MNKRNLLLMGIVLSLSHCTTNPGTRDLPKAATHVSMALEGDGIVTVDDYEITLDLLAVCLDAVTVNSISSTDPVAVSLVDEELGEFLEVENIDAGAIDDIELAFCEADAEQAASVLVSEGETVEIPELEGLTIYAEASATNGVDECGLIIRLDSRDAIELGGDGQEFEDGAEIELALNIHAAHLFEEVELASTGCTGSAEVIISIDSNADIHDTLLEEMEHALEIESLEVVEADSSEEEESGHAHSHAVNH